MHAVGVAQTRRADPAVEQRVIDRMKHAIAQSANHGKAGQHPITRAPGVAECSQANQRQTTEHHRQRTQTVHHKAGGRLHRAGDHEKNRHQKTKLGVAHAKFGLKPRKKRCQQQLAKVTDQMGHAHQTNDAGVLAQRRGCGLAIHGACGVHRAIVIDLPIFRCLKSETSR